MSIKEEFIQFLGANYNAFIRNAVARDPKFDLDRFIYIHQTYEAISTLILGAFVWEETPEGEGYWDELDILWGSHCVKLGIK